MVAVQRVERAMCSNHTGATPCARGVEETMNIANRLTLARLFVGIVALVVLALYGAGAFAGRAATVAIWTVLVLFTAAAATDALDGYLARSRGIVTPFGRIADPFVDKVIVAGSLILLSSIPATGELLAPWMVVLVVSREFLVNGIRGWMESEGVNFQAEKPGKYKMVLQVLAIIGLLFMLAMPEPWSWLSAANRVVIWAMLVLTVYSGVFYVRKAARLSGEITL